MEINKEELEKYVEAIKAVIDNNLFNDLSKCVDSVIKNIPKLSEHIGLNNSYEINEMLDKRLEATYVEQSSLHLEEHLKQLNTLYKNMSSQMYSSSVISNLFKNMSAFGTLAGTPQNNPYYPKESYDEFIAKMIEKKKMKIEKVLDLK